MSKLTRNNGSRIERPQSRWVGQPVEPQNERGKSPNGRQKHYGAVELPGVGEQIYVNDVVQVLPKHNSGGSEKERFRLTQVLSMWEDTFTGVFKFRARLLIHASELPGDVLSRLCAARRTFSNGIRSSKHNKRCGDDEIEDNEVFLTPRMEDLEVRLIVRPVTLSVTPSPETTIPVDLEGKMGPRLTHTYDDSTGDFAPVDDNDPIFKHARVRQSKGVDTASRANQEHDTAKNVEPVKSTGWLLPKRSVFKRKCRGEIGSHCHRSREVKNGSCASPVSPVHVGSPVSALVGEISKDSELEMVSDSENEERKKGVDRDGEGTSTDNDPPASSKQIATIKGGFMRKKSARQLKSQSFSYNKGEVNRQSFVASFCSTTMLSSSSQRHSRASSTTEARFLPPRPRRLDMPPVSAGGQQVAVPDSKNNACTTTANQLKTRQTRPSSIRDAGEAQVKSSHSRKLPQSSSSGSPTSAVKRSRVSCNRRKSSANATTEATSTNANGGFPGKMAQEESGYPPIQTPVGKEFQTEIPDLLSYEERKRASTETSARMVWRSIRDWDPKSRGMLAEYLHAAKKVVQMKQARPGVAVHVRLGGTSIGVDPGDGQIDSTDRAGSYAVWAVTVGRDTSDVARVACSEMAQTEVPRSAIQRVQCEEEALAALVKTRCILDDFDPALDLLAKTSSGPESMEQWTLNQVRTLERALQDEFDPKRRLHGWARPGMVMDREDFIDLATVSKRVPGKTPAQVLSFYYRYLAAAEPLTDVVYGPKAAEARRQEKIPLDCEVGKPDYLGGGPARGSSRTASIKAGSTQISDGSLRASSSDLMEDVSSESGSGLPERRPSSSKSQVLRLPSPKPSQEHILKASKANVDQSTATDTSVRHIGYEEAEPPLCQATNGKYGYGAGTCSSGFTAPNLPVARSNRPSHAVDGMTSAGGGLTERPFHRNGDDDKGGHCARNETTSGAHAVINEDVNCNSDGGRARHSAIQNGKRVRYSSTDSSSNRPPAPEIFEVLDSDEGKRSQVPGGDRRRAPPSIPDAKALLHKLVAKAAATHPNTLGPRGLKRVAGHMLSPSAGPVSAPTIQPPITDSVRPWSGAHKGSSMERPRTGRVNTPYAVQIREAGLTEVRGHAIWDRRSAPRSNYHDPDIRRHDGGYMYGVGGSSTPELGTGPPNNNVQHTLEEAPTDDDMFGVMAPCWRLLERAKLYMEKDQLVYMRGLILLHAKKPMSRNQLLERAESCLREQGHIFAAFVKMFDRISQPPPVPLYPTKKKQPGPSPSSGRRQVMPYTSPYALPATVPEHPGPALYSSAPRTFRGEAWKHKAVSPSDVSICSADINQSPYGRESSYPRPAAGKPGGVWCPPRLGGGSDGVVHNPSGSDPPVMPISEYSRREVPNLNYAFRDGGLASRKVWTPQWLHRPLHQPSQWLTDFRNASVAAMAAAEEGAKRGESGGGSTSEPVVQHIHRL